MCCLQKVTSYIIYECKSHFFRFVFQSFYSSKILLFYPYKNSYTFRFWYLCIYIFQPDATFRFCISKQNMRPMIYVDIVEAGICWKGKIFFNVWKSNLSFCQNKGYSDIEIHFFNRRILLRRIYFITFDTLRYIQRIIELFEKVQNPLSPDIFSIHHDEMQQKRMIFYIVPLPSYWV